MIAGPQKTPPRYASFLSQHLEAGGTTGLSPISLRRLLRQGAGESGAETGRSRAVPASVAAPGIAPAPAPAGLRSRLAEPPRRSKSASIPAGLVGGGGAGGGSLPVTHKQPGGGARVSGRGSRQHRVEGPGSRLFWALEGRAPVLPPLPLPPIIPSTKPALYWFSQPWKAIQILFPGVLPAA